MRSGHLGDVIMTEPIGRYFRNHYDRVYLATDFMQAKMLIGDTYTDLISYSHLNDSPMKFEKKIVLNYELSPQCNYIDGYARSADISLSDRIPKVKDQWERIIDEDYLLLAPHTSYWVHSMRNWGEENFRRLKDLIEMKLDMRVVTLDKHYSFIEMLSLIRHCKLLIGNDSAPGIIAQCFDIPAVIIFGATHPRYVLFNQRARPIHRDMDCIGCRHISRHTEIQCGSPFCMTELDLQEVYKEIKTILHEEMYGQ